MTAVGADRRDSKAEEEAHFRYGLVFLLVLTLLVFEVVTADNNWGRAIGVGLAGGALTVAVGTSRARGHVRQVRARVVAVVSVIAVIGAATGILSASVVFLVASGLLAGIPIALGGGLLRLIGTRGVTLQAVAGALTVYLVLGLLFASVIAFVSHVESGPYFAQGTSVPRGIRVYYSFTVLTTTGFGDYTAGTSVGRALAVLEMLAGQLYLVTVIGVVVGNFAGRRTAPARRRDEEE